MGTEKQAIFFVGKKKNDDGGNSLRIFHAPHGEGLALPREVLRAQSAGRLGRASLWNLITGHFNTNESDNSTPHIEPVTVEQLQEEMNDFLKTQSADELVIAEDAPAEVTTALTNIQETLAAESRMILANMFGLVIPEATQQPMPIEDNRPYPGLYL